ncbi:MAG: hypothetical protein EXX96DRAFT_615451 [Benjaminiella poitrasii]|nr:MAG: hypothetical protein EXX96DRAFT_615451 [Benjaminiella poitrasii]
MPDKNILEEASYHQIKDCLKDVLSEAWSNMNMIQKLSQKFYFNKEETTKSTLKQQLSDFWDQNITASTNSKRVKQRAKKLLSTLTQVVDSRPVSILIKKNLSEQENLHFKAGFRLQAAKEVNQEQEEEVAAQEEAVEQEEVVVQKDSDSAPRPSKRRKRLDLKKVKKLDLEGKVETIANFNDKQMLDLSNARTIPSRCKDIIDSILIDSGLQLHPRLTISEYDVLTKISECTNKSSLDTTVNEIDLFSSQVELSFIKLAVMKLCLLYHGELLEGEHNEDWYRVNVYGDVFDLLFNSKHGYKTKRSECHSQTIKALKANGLVDVDKKDIRLDFIFTNSTGIQDVFFCEDKPTIKVSNKDKNKADYLRESALRHWSSLLPYEECTQHLCALSCHFNKLNLRIMGTKLVNGIMIHACLKEIAIPLSDNNGAGIAEYLTAVISLVRMVTWNFEAIQLMIQTVQQDNMTFLAKPATSKICYREDSPASEGSNITNTDSSSSSVELDWEEDEKKLRIMENIESNLTELAKKANEQYVSSSWENIVFGKQPE